MIVLISSLLNLPMGSTRRNACGPGLDKSMLWRIFCLMSDELLHLGVSVTLIFSLSTVDMNIKQTLVSPFELFAVWIEFLQRRVFPEALFPMSLYPAKLFSAHPFQPFIDKEKTRIDVKVKIKTKHFCSNILMHILNRTKSRCFICVSNYMILCFG